MVKLLTLLWLFNPSQPALSTLTPQTPQAQFASPSHATGTFTVKFTVDLKKFDGRKDLLEIPNVLKVCLRQHDPRDRQRQNYPAFKMPDGSVPVLEATVTLSSTEHPNWRDMTIGVPLALLEKPDGEHEIALNFSGAAWTLYVDGELLDNDYAFGYPQWAAQTTWKQNAEYVKRSAIYLPESSRKRSRRTPPAPRPTFNIGSRPDTTHGSAMWQRCSTKDVITCSICIDRRHHVRASLDAEAHYFEHISTTDFTTWVEHEAATPSRRTVGMHWHGHAVRLQ